MVYVGAILGGRRDVEDRLNWVLQLMECRRVQLVWGSLDNSRRSSWRDIASVDSTGRITSENTRALLDPETWLK